MSHASSTLIHRSRSASEMGMRRPARAAVPGGGRHARPEDGLALDAPTDVLPVIAPAPAPAHPYHGGVFDGRESMITQAGGGAEGPSWWRAVGVLAAVVGGVALVGGLADGASSSTAATTSHTPVAGATVGTSALGCDVQSMGPTTNATMTDPVCTRAAILDIACGFDVSDIAPSERHWAVGDSYLWADTIGSTAQFTTISLTGGSTTTMTCTSDGRGKLLRFTGDEWSEFNGVGTLSSAMRTKLGSA